ncbi:protein NRT1/ PTR FAMILY 8.3-like [Melia azedarach]|uniref:Protein NRT1/ PTR FAMILY 8.3-like n=1 Tax=Melia azedarach TaxID=155640 RepID=A0ACC1XHG7_MELAZ|nr:protein NRT1/ PTR FAMILY 8.3-like [Melia azedarach]
MFFLMRTLWPVRKVISVCCASTKTGNWKACTFILGTECCERLAYYGIASNLVSYLTNTLQEGNVSAARNVTNWKCTCYLTPLIGAIIADAYLGKYLTISIFSTICFIGMCTLTLSATIPALKPVECEGSLCPSATTAQYAVFFLGLYLVALGTGCIKPCVSSFGADQFDDTDPRERVKKGSFFNWFYFCINDGALISSEELKILVRMFPIWATGIVFAAILARMSTMFVEQRMTMGTSIGSFTIPPACLSTFDIISVILCVPAYDSVIVHIARKFTGTDRGFSQLQRMGIGLILSVLCMMAAAIVEIKRFKLARELGLVDQSVAVPLCILWKIP